MDSQSECVAGAKLAPLPAFRFRLPSEMREVLKAQVTAEAGSGKEGYYLRLSDTKDRFLRVLFFESDDPVVHCRVEFNSAPAAVTEITGAIKKNGLNILHREFGSFSWAWSLADLKSWRR